MALAPNPSPLHIWITLGGKQLHLFRNRSLLSNMEGYGVQVREVRSMLKTYSNLP